MTSRRGFLAQSAGRLALAALAGAAMRSAARAAETFAVRHSEAEWRAILTPEQYLVLREEATEPPFSSPLNEEKRAGIFHCAGCDQAVYASADKYDSGTGWPSFSQSLPGAVGLRQDYAWFLARTEVHCARCGGHLGHVFDDGPEPTGLRHCLNGLALVFRPAA